MFRSYLKSTFRKLIKDKEYTVINLVGLSTGLVLFLIISIYIGNERSVDRHLADWDEIYRVTSKFSNEEGLTEEYAVSYQPLAEALKNDLAKVSFATTFYSPSAQFSFRSGDEMVSVENHQIYFTDQDFFNVFDHQWVGTHGRLDQPNTTIISDKLAEKFFGNANEALGQTLTYQDPQRTLSLLVSGVYKTSNAPSHLSYEMLIQDESGINFWNEGIRGNWNYLYVYTYFKTLAGTQKYEIDEALSDIRKRYQANRENLEFSAQPLGEVYFNPKMNEPGTNGNIMYVYVFGAFGLIVLVLAAVNFINLMVARSVRRIKEVAVRKVVGASRRWLILQFLFEASVLALLAMIVAGVLVERLMSVINSSFDLNLSFDLFQNTQLMMVMLITPFVIGLASGLYPALIVSRYKVNTLLKGTSHLNISGSTTLRKVLLGFQFFVSILVISGVSLINNQLSYVKANGLGFKEDPVIVLPRISSKSNMLIRERVADHVSIKAMASLSAIPGYRNPLIRNIKASNSPGEGVRTNAVWVSEQYSDILELEFISGRNFNNRDDENSLILNRKAIDALGWTPAEALTQRLIMTGRSGFEEQVYDIVGVVEDYNYGSMYEAIEPLFLKNDSQSTVGGKPSIVEISRENFDETLTYLSSVWNEIEQNEAFDFYFLDDAMRSIYENEIKLSKVTQHASIISLLICFLGLYGILNLTLASKKKEISLRKVLGASGKNLAQLLSTDYFKIILVAVIFCLPLSYIIINRWLENFAYRIEYSFLTYAMITAILMVSSLLLVSVQTLRASNVNPVDALRDE